MNTSETQKSVLSIVGINREKNTAVGYLDNQPIFIESLSAMPIAYIPTENTAILTEPVFDVEIQNGTGYLWKVFGDKWIPQNISSYHELNSEENRSFDKFFQLPSNKFTVYNLALKRAIEKDVKKTVMETLEKDSDIKADHIITWFWHNFKTIIAVYKSGNEYGRCHIELEENEENN